MPTKRNYGGEQQNYVPKGNEAGGQYGDDETGSNVNWKNPSKLVKGVKEGLNVGVQVEPSGKKGANDISKSIEESKIGDSSKKLFKKAWDGGNETSKKIINMIPEKINVELKDSGQSFFTSGTRYVSIAESVDEYEGWYDKEDTIYHELGHAVDMLYCKGYQKTKAYIRGLPEYEGYSKKSLSYSYKTSNGKTLNETLNEELDKKTRKRMIDDYTKETKESGKDRDEIDAKYSNLSDMCQACGGGKKEYGYDFSGYGHSRGYWKEYGDHKVKEFFAEAFSAKSSSNKEKYELIKKYLPNTCKAFDEIYEALSKANGKYLLEGE